jgi:hypothetical protein
MLAATLNDLHQPECPNAEVVNIAEANTVRIQARVGAKIQVVLDSVVERIDGATRTLTRSKMAERMLRTAADGVTDRRQLMAFAIEEGSQPMMARADCWKPNSSRFQASPWISAST